MKIKTIVTGVLAAGTFAAGAFSVAEEGVLKNASLISKIQQSNDIKIVRSKSEKFGARKNKFVQSEYFKKNAHEGKHRYIVRLIEKPVTTYTGGKKGFNSVNPVSKKSGLNNQKFSPNGVEAKKYAQYLESRQNSFLSNVSAKLGLSISKLRSYKYAINGIVTELTYSEAQRIANLPQVEFVEKDEFSQLNTDTSPVLIGADKVWDGTAGSAEFKGEGVILGILDTGVNTDHPSFAESGDDGYAHVNPLGSGVYLGDCVATPSLCNSKLIGVRSYSEITDAYSDPIFAANTRPANGEDYNGHGSHTASTAGGNTLTNVSYWVNDYLQGDTGDGIELPYTFASISGVAPRANIISYQVCLPGNSGDTYSGCPNSATLAAIEDAITDGVDVINYSIGGSTPYSPWTSSTEIAFLSAQAAGIFVATSAGNSGPDAYTTTKASPWYTSTAASTHGYARVSGDGKSIGTFSGGDTTPPSEISGGGTNGSFTGDIVYAGDFSNPNDPSGDPAQCLEAFPASTFTSNQIVLCDRGSIARVAKAANVADGGAGGFVLANLQGGASNIADDFYAVPGIQINADDGDALKTWLASGVAHTATISAATLSRDTNTADQIADFSSRGPNEFVELVTPQVAAPGVDVYAAYADDQPFNDSTASSPVDFAFLNGTSMAAPHVAGAAALVTQAQPSWNPDQIRSALMMTSIPVMLKEDGTTAADMFDMGAGRIQIDSAINAGLVMSETEANYLAADPAEGGDPKSLNTPSMANFACAAQCSWVRTFTAVNAGTYSFSPSDDSLSIEPASIEAEVNSTYSVTFTMDVATDSTGSEIFASAEITSTGQPDLHLPVFVRVNNGAVPEGLDIIAGRNNGSIAVAGIQSIPTDNLLIELDGLYDANASGLAIVADFDIAEDPTNDDAFDDISQVYVNQFDVPNNTATLNVRITETTSPDLDLFVQMDSTGDGAYDTLVDFSATAETLESVSISTPEAGSYRVVIQNWASSAAPSDTGTVEIEVVSQSDPLPGLTVIAPSSADGISPLDVALMWDLEMTPGDSYYGDINVSAGETFIGTFPITLSRVADDVAMSASDTLVTRGDTIDYTITVKPNVYSENLGYKISVDMPSGAELISAESNGGEIVLTDPNAQGLNLAEDFDIAEDQTNDEYKDDLSQVFVQEFEVPASSLELNVSIAETTSPDLDLFVEFDAEGDGNWSLIGYSATEATLESVSISSPNEGLWRVIVQNWAGSAADSDTGSVNITTTPATGDGFIWTATSEVAKQIYSVVSSENDAVCAAAGFGGYLSLEDLGIGTAGASGDSAIWSVFSDWTFPFFGEQRQGMNITDDGFAVFAGTQGSSPWVNVSIPNAAQPNDMIAMFWRDQEVVDDGATRGIRLGSIPGLAVVDFDELQPWNTPSERFSYQVLAFDSVSDDHDGMGPYEYIVAYSDTQVGSFSGATAGVENFDGSVGTDASSLIQPGVQLCYDAATFGQEYQITFRVATNNTTLGNPISPSVSIETDMDGTEEMTVASYVELVNVAPIANAGPDVTYDRSNAPEQIKLTAGGTVDVDQDRLLFNWTQTGGGETLELSGQSSIHAFFSLEDAPNGTYTFNVDVSDSEFSSSDEVTIVIEGVGKSTGGGAMNFFMFLLMFGAFAVRKRINR